MSDFGMTMIMGVEFPQVIPYTIIQKAYGTDGELYELEYSLVDMRKYEYNYKEIIKNEKLRTNQSNRKTK